MRPADLQRSPPPARQLLQFTQMLPVLQIFYLSQIPQLNQPHFWGERTPFCTQTSERDNLGVGEGEDRAGRGKRGTPPLPNSSSFWMGSEPAYNSQQSPAFKPTDGRFLTKTHTHIQKERDAGEDASKTCSLFGQLLRTDKGLPSQSLGREMCFATDSCYYYF